MSDLNTTNESNNETTLATVAMGVVAAVLFLLVSSYMSTDSTWTKKSSKAWGASSFKVDSAAEPVESIPVKADLGQSLHKEPKSVGDEHSFDGLYREDFMNSFPEPT